MSTSQRVVQVCLFVLAAIALSGGLLQISLGESDTSPRLDNVHRFMAGVYFSTGLIALWAGIKVREQGTLVYLLAFGVLMAAIGRLISIYKVSLPEPSALWLAYLVPELVLPVVMALAHRASGRPAKSAA